MKRYRKKILWALERDIGKMTQGRIQDVYDSDPERAITYACRDADCTLRVAKKTLKAIVGNYGYGRK